MQFLYSCHTDPGVRKKVNQDAYIVRTARNNGSVQLLAAVCDGVGGLSCGERASGEVISAFSDWFAYELPQIASDWETRDAVILQRWKQMTESLNRKLAVYGRRKKIRLATTATVVLFAWGNYYVCHVGDCRFYVIGHRLEQLTSDHSLIEQEINAGRLTREDAEKDYRKNVILRCIGAMKHVTPDLLIGKIQENAVYLLCSDGFRHKITEEELKHTFSSQHLNTPEQIKQSQIALTELAKQRGEKDNITVVIIKINNEGMQEII